MWFRGTDGHCGQQLVRIPILIQFKHIHGAFFMLTHPEVFVALFNSEAIIWLFTYCTPLEAYWDPHVGSCKSFTLFLDLTWFNIGR